MKSASDLGVPLVGIGLLYREGYFRQHLDADGWQHESYPRCSPDSLPVSRVRGADQQAVSVSVETRSGTIHAAVWELRVGQVRLFLLDSDVVENSEEDRSLTARLYGGDERTRVRQELLLGVGGLRALTALGIRPSVVHLNEGHCAFAALEWMRMYMEEEGYDSDSAAQQVRTRTVFTTHTPVPAGHDRFSAGLIEDTLGPLREALGLSKKELMQLGGEPGDERFCMTVLALRLAERANGVSALHGRVSRQMWQSLWPSRAQHEVPIGHVTNGVHLGTWLAPRAQQLYDRHFPAGWAARQRDPEVWSAVDRIEDRELWATHQELKRDLIHEVRRRAAEEAKQRNESADVIRAFENALAEDVLLLGFARRFAPYKRASLVLADLDQLDRWVNGDRPLQLVFAGKAHPRDDRGKALIQQIYRVTRDPRFIGKVVLLESYAIEIAKKLVAGVDVWLNNPRRPLEASGTSGQKAALHGGLNCSILDGWWAEGYDGHNGFAIGTGGVHRDPEIQDARDFESLCETLQNHVVPLYYQGGANGLSTEWIARMKRSIRTLGWRFNAHRMVLDYAERCYLPAAGAQLCDVGHAATLG